MFLRSEVQVQPNPCSQEVENLLMPDKSTYTCGPGYGTRGQRAYEMRIAGHSWTEIAISLQPPSLGSINPKADPESAVTNAAKKYAKAKALPWPIPFSRAQVTRQMQPPAFDGVREVQKSAYDLRAQGGAWSDVATATGYSFPSHAIAGAKRHAFRERLPWPVR